MSCDGLGAVAARRMIVTALAIAAGLHAGFVCAQAKDATSAASAPTSAATMTASMFAEALAYEHGEGVPKDPIKAAFLYCSAARDGDVEAQFSLGWMYANGRGVGRDDNVASALFALAAASGHAYARRALEIVGREAGPLPDCMRPPEPPLGLPASAEFEITVDDPDPFADLPPWKQKIADVVVELAPRYAVDPRLALAVIAVESNFEPTARSPKDARGLMQLIPETAARFNVRDSYNVKDNVRGGLSYLRWLLAYYRGDVRLTAAAYNAGEKAVDKYRGVPPYAETRDYVRRIRQLFRPDLHPYDARIADPSPIVASDRVPRS